MTDVYGALRICAKAAAPAAWAAVLAVALGFFISCSAGEKRGVERAGVKVVPSQLPPEFCCVRSVAVVNLHERGDHPGGDGGYRCGITGLNFTPGAVMEGAGEIVADQLRNRLMEMGFLVAERETTMETVAGGREDKEHFVEMARRVGMELEVDAVVIGSVMRFEERVGTKLAAEKPASVAFSVAFIRPADGQILWKAKFEKTQKAFFEDVLDYKTFVKGGMVWQRAEELSAIGVDTLVKQVPFQPGAAAGE